MKPKIHRRRWPEVHEEEHRRFPEVYAAYHTFKRAVRAGERPDRDRPFIVVECEDDLPLFADEAEEHEYWGTHTPGDTRTETAGSMMDEDQPMNHNRSRATR